MAAGVTIGLGLWYLSWRWTASLNHEAMLFSVSVATAETMAFLGTLLFFFNLERTLGYFRDTKVAFVQTPHWFYDIPEGQDHEDWLEEKIGRPARILAPALRMISGRQKMGTDPFLSRSDMFFDVIQRRRNRSFLPMLDMQLFKYHVSEDIFTALQQHSKGWRSVYHPEVLARMLSPWSMNAWATQKLKYAGGTFDIMLRSNLIWRRGLPWQTRLHYMATFWSYLAVLWMPILFLAPMISLLTGLAPVDAYSIEFFLHLIPLLLANELAMSIGCKGHDIHTGRTLSLATLNIQLRALGHVLRGQKPHFPTTSKNPAISDSVRYAIPALSVLAIMAVIAVYGIFAYYAGWETHSASLVVVNLFWMGLNAIAFGRVALAAFWLPRLPNGRLLQFAP